MIEFQSTAITRGPDPLRTQPASSCNVPSRRPVRSLGILSCPILRGGACLRAITPATKIRTHPYSRFGPATADRGSRGIRDQPRNPPKSTEKRIRNNFPFPCPSRGQLPPVGWGRSVVTRL